MRSNSKGRVAVDVVALEGLCRAEVFTQIDETRTGTLLIVPTVKSRLVFLGTPDQLLDFASAILGSVYSWIIASGHYGWLADRQPATQEQEGAEHE